MQRIQALRIAIASWLNCPVSLALPFNIYEKSEIKEDGLDN